MPSAWPSGALASHQCESFSSHRRLRCTAMAIQDKRRRKGLGPLSGWSRCSACCSRSAGARWVRISRDPKPPSTRAGRRRATRGSRLRRRPTACGGKASMIRRSIAWSSSPTGRTCRCRSPACGSWRRAPSSASPPAGSFRRCRSLRQRDRGGAQPNTQANLAQHRSQLSGLSAGLRCGLGAGFLGQVPAGRGSGSRQPCSRR